MQILDKLVRPASLPGDAQAMHAVVLCIVSSRLEKSLKSIRRRYPSVGNATLLLESLKPHLGYERTAYCTTAEIESWTSASGGKLRHAVKTFVHSLITWTSSPAPNYTHRVLFTALAILGARSVLWLIVDEVKSQTGNASLAALDVGVSLICAPSTHNSPTAVDWITSPVSAPIPPRSRLNLRDALRLELDDAAHLFNTDPLAAETIVRLHRKVEGQLAVATVPGLSAPLPDLLEPMDITVTDGVAAAGSLEETLDLSAAAGDLGLDSSGPLLDMGAGDAILGDADDDLFNSLMLG